MTTYSQQQCKKLPSVTPTSIPSNILPESLIHIQKVDVITAFRMPKVDCLNRKRELQRARRALFNSEVRQNERTSNTERMRDVRTNPEVRQNEQTSNTDRMQDVRTNP
jgi:hypothetical protein